MRRHGIKHGEMKTTALAGEVSTTLSRRRALAAEAAQYSILCDHVTLKPANVFSLERSM